MEIIHFASRHSLSGLDNLFAKPVETENGIEWMRPAWLAILHLTATH